MEVAENKGSEPKEFGMPKLKAYRNVNTHKGYWAIAESGILTPITNERLALSEYYDISEAYKSLHYLCLNRRELNGTHGGVRGWLSN